MNKKYKITAFGIESKKNMPPREMPDPEQVKQAREVLAQCEQVQTIYKRHSSYGLKHVLERFLGSYISNGAFIQAAILEGYTLDIVPPNAKINISRKSVKYLKSNKIKNHGKN